MITKLVRYMGPSGSWGNEGDEAYVTAHSLQEIEDMLPGPWEIIESTRYSLLFAVPQRDRIGIKFLKRYDDNSTV